ncbi:MAG: DNA-directed RNA polymerase subunit alpha [Deltaproteobacteria bacterium]
MQINWRSLIKPKRVEIDKKTHTRSYGEFVCQPLERGFGTTIGNSIRRVLLSSIHGSAVVSVRIDGVMHEFDTVPGVKEDMTDIILNLKGVRLKLHSKEQKIIVMEASGKGSFTAGDIKSDATVEVLNPEHHIMTLSGSKKVRMEITVASGRGYIPAKLERASHQPDGTINIDALFSPIRKVNYNVTHARVGQITDYDRLEMQIGTDGSILPEDAIAYAAKIIKEQLDVFINFDESSMDEEIVTEVTEGVELITSSDNMEELLSRRIEDFEFKPRPMNCFKKSGVDFVGQLVQIPESEMLRMKNFGKKSLDEVQDVLKTLGLSFGMTVDFIPPNKKKQE